MVIDVLVAMWTKSLENGLNQVSVFVLNLCVVMPFVLGADNSLYYHEM